MSRREQERREERGGERRRRGKEGQNKEESRESYVFLGGRYEVLDVRKSIQNIEPTNGERNT